MPLVMDASGEAAIAADGALRQRLSAQERVQGERLSADVSGQLAVVTAPTAG